MKIDLDKKILQNILQYSNIGIHVIDKDRKTIIYNEVMANLEGLDIKQIMGKDLLDIFPSLDKDTSTLVKVLDTGMTIINRTQSYLNFKGKKITSVNSTIPLYSNKEIIGALEIANNMTHISKLSDQLLELQNELKSNNLNLQSDEIKIKRYTFIDIIGKNKSFELAKKIGRKASMSSSSVLIYGDTGTGKELFAQSIHYSGIRKDKAFIAQNCAAIPESLLEGILFGTDKGGFTGALEREGIFEQASGGTLMLDEINSMSIPLQAKLLRVLQEGYIRRIGGIKDIPVDVRIIATTNEDPLESIKKGILRKDLFYRLNVIFISLPALKNRKDDIPILVDYFINKYNSILEKKVEGVSNEVLNLFMEYDWPGNARELENVIESSINMVGRADKVLELDDLAPSMHMVNNNEMELTNIDDRPLPLILEKIEKDIILKALKNNDNNISRTALELGIKRQTLQHKLKKYTD